jgi:hypothetical protein
MYCERGTTLEEARLFLNWLLKDNNVPWNFQIIFPVALDFTKKGINR